MKRALLVIAGLAAIALAASSCRGDEATIRGSVTADGRAISGVVVTDGVNLTATDARGKYRLPLSADSRFVYISTPAGYYSPVEEGVVKYFIPLEQGRREYRFTLTPKPLDDTRHGFIALADPQVWAVGEFAPLAEAAEDIRATLESYAGVPFHGICAGDIVGSDHGFYPEYNRIMALTGMPFRNSMGNHDMDNYGRSHETAQSTYEAMFGPAYYSYNVGKVHYVSLNNSFFIGRDWFYIGYLDERQLSWLEKDLSYVPAGSTVVVHLHIPTSVSEADRAYFNMARAGSTMTNHKGLYEVLAPYNAHIISGHTHTMHHQIFSPTLREHVVAALSGAWWQGELCTDGTPRGYAVYEIDGNELRWHYRSTGHPADYQMRVYTAKDSPEFAGSVVANVWNADPDWTVELWADGRRVSQMENFTGIDPDAAAMYAPDKKLDHQWISARPTSNLFRAAVPHGAREVEVVATDGFGNIFRGAPKE